MAETPIATPLDALDFPELDPMRPTATQIYTALKTAILSTDLPPSFRISEAEIGQKFATSRTPVREAFALLREAGLVVTRPSRGNYVSTISELGIRQAQFLREGLELANVIHLCEHGIPADIRHALQECLAAQASAVASGNTVEFQHQDDRYHALLARGTGYPRAETVLLREKAALDRLRVLSLSSSQHRTDLLDEHRQIFDAICAGDKRETIDLTKKHLRSILRALSQLRDENGEYFE